MKKIAVIPNSTKDKDYKCTKKLVALLKGRAEIVMPTTEQKSGIDTVFKGDNLYDDVDCVVILGGDGTMLRAAEPCGKRGIPVLGINLGTVGFMTEVIIDDIDTAIDKLLAEDYVIEERMMMEIEVIGSSGVKGKYFALNDTVVSKPNAEMVKMELYEDSEKVSEYIADGLIVSTPTGSTGYSLSAGGPVADPTINLFIATPICAHRLSARPMLLSDRKEIKLKIIDGGCNEAIITVDGHDKCTVTKDDTVNIRRWDNVFKIIKLGKQSFYYTMMTKL